MHGLVGKVEIQFLPDVSIAFRSILLQIYFGNRNGFVSQPSSGYANILDCMLH
jgi:hypothetical protein